LFDSSEVKFLRTLVESLRKDNAELSTRIGLLADPLVLARQAGAERARAQTVVAVEHEKSNQSETHVKLVRPSDFRRTADRPDPAIDLTPRPKLTPEEAEAKFKVYGA
jgi:hypothetical protein